MPLIGELRLELRIGYGNQRFCLGINRQIAKIGCAMLGNENHAFTARAGDCGACRMVYDDP